MPIFDHIHYDKDFRSLLFCMIFEYFRLTRHRLQLLRGRPKAICTAQYDRQAFRKEDQPLVVFHLAQSPTLPKADI
jgi:hypothetical protein